MDCSVSHSSPLPHTVRSTSRNMQTLEVLERQNRWRLELAVHACKRRLQELVRETFEVHNVGVPWQEGAALASEYPDLLHSMTPQQSDLVRSGVSDWDVAMCQRVLTHMRSLKSKAKALAVARIITAQNCCADAVDGRITKNAFRRLYRKVTRAFGSLGGDIVELQQIRARTLDSSEESMRQLAVSDEATNAAMKVKAEGNRCFRTRDYEEAERLYTKGVQLSGAVDPLVLAHLYSNRAAARLHLREDAAAMQDAKQAVDIAPQWTKAHVRLAEVYHAASQHDRAVSRLETAVGLANAERDTALVRELEKKMAEYRLLRDQKVHRESASMASRPMCMQKKAYCRTRQAMQSRNRMDDLSAALGMLSKTDVNGVGAESHVRIGHRALNEGRLLDAAREFKAAANAGSAEGMYNYAVMLVNGDGMKQDITEAVKWLEKVVSEPVSSLPHEKVCIGEALGSLGNLYNDGVHFERDEDRAREYWESAADLGAGTGCNNLGVCLTQGTHGLGVDLPRARDLFRQSAEMLNHESMANLASIHASLSDFETAARWAESACVFGCQPAAERARQYRALSRMKEEVGLDTTCDFEPHTQELECNNSSQRWMKTPSLEELRAVDTPFGKRLLAAKELMIEASHHTRPDLESLIKVVQLASKAERIDGGRLVFTIAEIRAANEAVDRLLGKGVLLNADMALLQNFSDPSTMISFWNLAHQKFPNDLAVTRRAARVNMSKELADDADLGISLLQKARSLLPHPDDDSDPIAIGLLYDTATAYFQAGQFASARELLARYLKHARADGHRGVGEAHFVLGLLAVMNVDGSEPSEQLRSHVVKAMKEASVHYCEGVTFNQRLPDFLRRQECVTPIQHALETFLSFFAPEIVRPHTSFMEAPIIGARRGGELLPGPRRHPKLRSDTSMLRSMWRRNHAEFAQLKNANRGMPILFTISASPARCSGDDVASTEATRATIDEVFSALQDREFKGRSIECIAVSVPTDLGSAYHVIVEDSQREPARIAICNATPAFIAQILPGRTLELLNPIVRIFNDGSIMLYADNPTGTIRVKTLHAICWVCAEEEQPDKALKRCAKCHTAMYCSKECQATDWNVDGHRCMCAAFRRR